MSHIQSLFVYLPGQPTPLVFRLSELLVESLMPIITSERRDITISYSPVNVESIPELMTPPSACSPPLISLDPAAAFLMLTVETSGRVIYRHAHNIDDLIRGPLLRRLRESNYSADYPYLEYSLGPSALSARRPTPLAQGRFPVLPRSDRSPRFRMRPVPDPELESASLADWHLHRIRDPESASTVTVILSPEIADLLLRTRLFSEHWEEGGFLVGYAFRDNRARDSYIIEIIGAPAAEHTGGSLVHLDFTGDSFSHIKQQLAHEFAGALLLGWYHTHLFPATDSLGLSMIDVNLHRTTFKRPWQVAGLLNVEPEGKRTLRFYTSSGDSLIESAYAVGGPRNSPG